MVKLRWTQQALDDIEVITDYIAKDSSFYAKMFAKKVFDSVDRIEIFPESGRIVPEINCNNIREILLGNYRIIYRIKTNVIEIITVYHSSRLLNIK